MLSVWVADRVRFESKKGRTVTALPVTVEFGQLVRGDRTSRLANAHQWSQLDLGDSDSQQIASPNDLLHAVVALYRTCLPDFAVPLLYRTVCLEGAKTLFLLRDTSEILQEWENRAVGSPGGRSGQDSLAEINNNPLTGQQERKNGRPGPTHRAEGDGRTTSGPDYPSAEEEEEEEGRAAVSPARDQWTPRATRNRRIGETDEERNFLSDWYHASAIVPRTGATTQAYSPAQSPFSDIFGDSADSGSDSEMEEEEDREDFSRGLETFLRSVLSRRKEFGTARESYRPSPSHVGIEHRLIASATFHKNYKIPGVRVVRLSLLTVRKRFRKCGVGGYFLQRLKNPSQVGPYDALVVRAKNSSQNFFKKNGFIDDVVLCSRFGDSEDVKENSTLLCYLPPFDGHYPPLPGLQQWDQPESVTAMREEIEKWKQKSLESYQAQFTCLTRLQTEVFRLHDLLKRQETTVTFLKKENYALRARLSRVERKSAQTLMEALEKEAADFERLCTLKLENLETA